MSKGFCLLAQNNKDVDYVKQACFLATSIRYFNKGQNISLITNDQVPKKYLHLFNKIIPILHDDAKDELWKIQNRTKFYDMTPYTQTIVMDVDMIVTRDITNWWKYLNHFNMYFVSNVKTYRNSKIDSDYYRKTFTRNNLPDIYSGIFYFRKNKFSKIFFHLLKTVVNNWKTFYSLYTPNQPQKFCSIDVSCAIVCKLLGIEKEVTDDKNIVSFVHMKPMIQGWTSSPIKWTSKLNWQLTDTKELIVGNSIQRDVFHYVEEEFLTDNILNSFLK